MLLAVRDGLLEVTERLIREGEVAVRPALLGRRGQLGGQPQVQRVVLQRRAVVALCCYTTSSPHAASASLEALLNALTEDDQRNYYTSKIIHSFINITN